MRAVRFIRSTMIWLPLLPIAFILLGAASNQLVLIANHGAFPVLMNDAQQLMAEDSVKIGSVIMLDEVHCVMSSQSHLRFLADIFNLGSAIFSIGDLLLYFGRFLSAFCLPIWIFVSCLRIHSKES